MPNRHWHSSEGGVHPGRLRTNHLSEAINEQHQASLPGQLQYAMCSIGVPTATAELVEY